MNITECDNSKMYCHKSIGIGIGNTFCQSIVIGIDNIFSQVLLTSLLPRRIHAVHIPNYGLQIWNTFTI